MKFQRDAFIDVIYDAAQIDNSIFFLSADFGAPSLDQFRQNLPNQFKHCGISEQHMIDLAVGLALDGNKVFCYAMAPFVSLRCLEQHKCGASIMCNINNSKTTKTSARMFNKSLKLKCTKNIFVKNRLTFYKLGSLMLKFNRYVNK